MSDAGNNSSPLLRIEQADHRLFLWLFTRTVNPVFEILMPVLSLLVNKGFIHIAAGTAMLVFGNGNTRVIAAQFLVSSLLAGVVAEVAFKSVWKRKRPFQVLAVIPKVPYHRLYRRPSFPSGHSSGYMAAAIVLASAYPRLAALFYIIGLLGSFSRVYNGVHFPSDVAAGIILGLLCGRVTILLSGLVFQGL